jgi:UDP-glucose 4-epimerase
MRSPPKSPYSGVISIFCERIPNGAPINIHGDGAQTRDFVHVSDVVAALLAGMRLLPEAATVLNVCTARATSVLQLARMIGELAGESPGVRYLPARAGEIRHSLGDPLYMRRVLGLGPMMALRDGLETVLANADARS